MSTSYKASKAAILISIISEYYTRKGKHVDYTVDTTSDYLTFGITDEYDNRVIQGIRLDTDEIIYALATACLSKIDARFFEYYQDRCLGEEDG